MTLNELIAEVYTITNRPDLVAQTLTAVRSATLKMHQRDYFYKDIFETAINFSTAAYLQQLEYRTLIHRWRALKYIRKTDSTAYQDGAFLDVEDKMLPGLPGLALKPKLPNCLFNLLSKHDYIIVDYLG